MNCATCNEIKNKDKYKNCFNCSSKTLTKYKDRQMGFCFNDDCARPCGDYLYCFICCEVIKAKKKKRNNI